MVIAAAVWGQRYRGNIGPGLCARFTKRLTIRKWPTYSALALLLFLICVICVIPESTADLAALSQIGLSSLLIFLTSLLYPAIGCFKLVKHWKNNSVEWGCWVALSVILLHLSSIVFLWSYGLIALRTWLM